MKKVNSVIRAIKAGLIEYLEASTEINWTTYDSSLPPSTEPKAGIKVARIGPPEHGGKELILAERYERKLLIQMRVILGSVESEDDCEGNLLDWVETIDLVMHSISLTGISGTWHDRTIRNALMGVRLTTRGHQPGVEEILSVQGSEDKLWKGLLYSEYEQLLDYDVPSFL